jgi:hypothetical protein
VLFIFKIVATHLYVLVQSQLSKNSVLCYSAGFGEYPSKLPIKHLTMNTLLAILASSLAAAAVQPVFLFCWLMLPILLLGQKIPWDQFLTLVFFSAIFALPFILLLGVPLTILLHRFGQLRWRWLAVAGALTGAIFGGLSGPGGGPGYSSGGNWYGNLVSFVVNGEPTIYGWLRYFRSILVFALHGVLGASVFFLVWVRFKRVVKG